MFEFMITVVVAASLTVLVDIAVQDLVFDKERRN